MHDIINGIDNIINDTNNTINDIEQPCHKPNGLLVDTLSSYCIFIMSLFVNKLSIP